MANTEYAVYYVTDKGEWDRSPIAIFDNWDEADCRANVLRMQYPEDTEHGDFVVCEH